MEHETTIHVINGSSLGGGEVDSILRAGVSGGSLLGLNPLVQEVRALAKEYEVEIITRKELTNRVRERNVTLVLTGFLRDLTLAPTIAWLKLWRRDALSIVLAVHSDPLSGLKKPQFSVRLALIAYQLFGFIFARRVRFVSARQLRTFPLLARWRPCYIDPPASLVTRALSAAPSAKRAGARNIDFLFIGRLSRSDFLGDAKNSDFIADFADYIETLPHAVRFTVVGTGNRQDIIEKLSGKTKTSLMKPTREVGILFSAAQAVIVPSLHEGYCLLVREAVLSGCRVLTTTAIAPELETLDGVTILDGFNPQDWYAAGLARSP